MNGAERVRKAMELAGRGESISSACKAAGISRKTFYKWKKRSLPAVPGPGMDSRPDAAGPDWKSLALSLALRHPEWGCDRIAYFLYLNGVRISSPTIQKHLIRHGLGRVQQRLVRIRNQAEGDGGRPLGDDRGQNVTL